VAVAWASTLWPGFSVIARSPLDAALLIATSLGALAIGLVEWTRDPTRGLGLWLALAGATWPLSAALNPGSGSSVIFTLSLAFPFVCAPLLTHVGTASLRSRGRSRLTTVIPAASWIGPVVLAGVLPALLSQPALENCWTCPPNLLDLASMPDAARSVRALGLAVTVAGGTATVAWLLVWFARATAPARTAALPVLGPSLLVLAVVAVNAVAALPQHDPWPNDSLWRACSFALLLTALGVAVGWWRIAIARQRIARLAVEIADSPRPGGVRSLLADQLHDPELVVAYAIEDGRSVGADGQLVDVAETSERQVSTITRDDVVIARLWHRRSLADDPERLGEVVRACRLALENERLQAASRARLAELRASRALVVETGDAARQRLERDLHDGAQQRLVSLALALRLCRSGLTESDTARLRAVDTAEAELRAAIDGLRTVAHGLYPAVLAEEGLAAGVEALRESSFVPIQVTSMPHERLPGPVEAAAWFTIEEATHGLDTGQVVLSVERSDGRLLVDLEHDGPLAPELIDVEDRIGALDGTLRVLIDAAGRSRVHADIPCAS
jgi:signal transduction histidine kinase